MYHDIFHILLCVILYICSVIADEETDNEDSLQFTSVQAPEEERASSPLLYPINEEE